MILIVIGRAFDMSPILDELLDEISRTFRQRARKIHGLAFYVTRRKMCSDVVSMNDNLNNCFNMRWA